MDENAKKQAEYPIMKAFDEWGCAFVERTFTLYQKATPEEKEKIATEYKLIDLFLSKRVFIPGFFKHVNEQVCKSNILKRQQILLLKSSLISLLRNEPLKIDDLTDIKNEPIKLQQSKADINNIFYTRRNIQRVLHDYYPEAYKELDEKQQDDERIALFSTIFDHRERLNNRIIDEAQQFERRIVEDGNAQYEMIISNFHLMRVMPDYLRDLLEFKKFCVEFIAKMGREDERAAYLADALGRYSRQLLTFHAYISSVIAVQWFRQRRASSQRRLIDLGFPLKYSEHEAKEARKLLMELTQDSDEVYAYITDAANAFYGRREMPASIALFEASLELCESPIKKGIAYDNIAICYREMKKYRLMRRYMKEACNCYRQAGDKYRISIALKSMGEAESMLGFKQKAVQSFSEAEKTGAELPEEERFKVLWNIACAMKRIGSREEERKYLIKCLKHLPERNSFYAHDAVERRLSELDQFFF